MKLQTKIPLEKQSDSLIDYNSNILLLGSCFVENIGEKLEYFKFQNLQNPFGILFNPPVINRLILNTVEEKLYSENDVFFHNERWHCYDVHSDLSSTSKEELLQNLNDSISLTTQQLISSTHIIITLGTAWVYRNIESGSIVANCHKVPQKQFDKEILSIDLIKGNLESIVSNIRKVNLDITVIFTVSPVRHLKDGFVENQQSKAHLISAIHQFINQKSSIGNRQSHYFPSYEIMMDELRDYRFYTEDMIHPNKTAVNYIWERFKETWIASESYTTMKEVESVQKGLSHRAFNEESQQYKDFQSELKLEKGKLEKQFPYMKF